MIGFRVDANEQIASGHLMRCLTLAAQLKEKGQESIFLLADSMSAKYIKGHGVAYTVLNGAWDKWNQDIAKVLSCIQHFGISCLIVDSYMVTDVFFKAIHQVVPIVYIDDLCEQAYDISMILCFTQSRRAEKIPLLYRNTNIKLLMGKEYLLLRKEFFPAHTIEDIVKKKNIMITTGGSDPYHITLEFVRAYLKNPFFEQHTLIVVLGSMNRDEEKIASLAEHKKVEIIRNTNRMGEIMRSCYAAVSAGGNTIYELCACAIPTVCISFSKDQIELGEALADTGILQYAGDIRKNPAEIIRKALEKLQFLLSDDNCWLQYREKMPQFIDGLGACRVAEEIIHFLK